MHRAINITPEARVNALTLEVDTSQYIWVPPSNSLSCPSCPRFPLLTCWKLTAPVFKIPTLPHPLSKQARARSALGRGTFGNSTFLPVFFGQFPHLLFSVFDSIKKVRTDKSDFIIYFYIFYITNYFHFRMYIDSQRYIYKWSIYYIILFLFLLNFYFPFPFSFSWALNWSEQ